MSNEYVAMMQEQAEVCHTVARMHDDDGCERRRDSNLAEAAKWQAAAEAFEALVEACCLFRAWCRPPESGEPTLPKTLVAVDVALKKAGVE